MPLARYIIIAILLGWLLVLIIALFKKFVLRTFLKFFGPKSKEGRRRVEKRILNKKENTKR
jgi:hypothetical protein